MNPEKYTEKYMSMIDEAERPEDFMHIGVLMACDTMRESLKTIEESTKLAINITREARKSER